MEQLYSNVPRKVIQSKKQIENSLKVKVKINGNIITIDGKIEDELIVHNIIEALNLGFTANKALLLKEEGFEFEKILIKKIANRRNLSQVRARVIGTNRKALDNIESLTDCFIALHDNTIGIIGNHENLRKALYVLKRIVAGSKHANMYAWLETQKALEKAVF